MGCPPSPSVAPEAQSFDRPIDRSLFNDHGVPEVGGLTPGVDLQDAAAAQVEVLGTALKDYRCRLNAAGVALVDGFPQLAGCEEYQPTH